MQHLLCVCSQIPLGHWEKPVEKMEEEILCVSAGMCFITSVPLLTEAVFFPTDSEFSSSAVHFHFHCACQYQSSEVRWIPASFWSSITAARQVLRWSLFLFLSPLCELQSARLCWIVTCLRAKSWQAAWLSKGPALAATTSHAHQSLAATATASDKQKSIHWHYLFTLVYVCVGLCACERKTFRRALFVLQNVSVGRKICQNALFAFWVFCWFHTFYLFVCFASVVKSFVSIYTNVNTSVSNPVLYT